MDIVEVEVDNLYRNQFGKMLSSLLRFSGDIDLEAAEDIVQDTFSAALVSWRKDGLPVNPVGWLYKVSRNRALNKIKESKKFSKSSGISDVDGVGGGEELADVTGFAAVEGLTDVTGFVGVEKDGRGAPIEDEQLILLFACAHPDLAPKVQVAISLKYVVNLRVESIAKILGLTMDGVDKILVRARQKIRDERILFHAPSAAALEPRLSSVHKVLYLIFNEGYKSSWGKELIREELCEEALIMTRALAMSRIGNGETRALYALMLFNAARIKARFGRDGELLDLEEQDRTLWDQDLIRLAMVNLGSVHGGGASTYYCEAAIAGLHCAAETYMATNWNAIIRIYRQLLGLQANPFVELNYAIALYYGGDKVQALGILHELEKQAFLGRYYLLHASLGRIYAAEGNKGLAKEYLETTLRLTNAPDEIAFVRRLIKKVE
jgi:RNA polymerase sigma factor (sigma-70 family)